MIKSVQYAVIITLALHAVILLTLTQIMVKDEFSSSVKFTEVELFDTENELEQKDLEVPIDQIQQRLNERISNLRSDESKESSSELKSTGITKAEQEAIDRVVKKELADLESKEMDRLSQEKKKFDTVGLPDESGHSIVDTMDDWDKKYEGRVTVKFDLENRSAQHLDVPGYRCKGRADIIVSIVVDDDGKIVSADLVSGAKPNSCFAEAALKSAKSSRFYAASDAPRRQSGTLTYAFVAQ
ncbi:MAG: hypothetical protein CL850_02520 [Crocinitomicaceae bacterium]|nr:hypothetical protein [Crocinitomicaceae bacterium]|tara:strand:- start:429 stop:1151 length:723 start_codon:yes stop_codon:yes gene_type:complete